MTGDPIEPFPFGVPINRPPPKAEFTPVPGRPNWFKDKNNVERYVEPVKPPQFQSLSQRLRAAGYTRRPSWRSLPSDE